MKKSIFIIVLLAVYSCESADKSSKGDIISNTDKKILVDTSDAEVSEKIANPIDTLAQFMDKMKNHPISSDWKVIDGPNMDIMTFKDVAFGDMIHFLFVDSKGNEYDFSANSTKKQLDITADNENDDDGIAPNPKFRNKKFKIVWRQVKLTRKPADELEMYYENHKEIIYLEKL